MNIRTNLIYLPLLVLSSLFSIFIYEKFMSTTETVYQTEKKSQTIKEKSEKIRILFGGDLMLNRHVKKKVYEKFNGDYFLLFKEINDYLNSFDFVILNLEGPISNRGRKVGSIYSFRMEPKILDSLKKANINVLNLANNHIFDYGKEAFLDTLVNLENANLYFFGAGRDKNEAYRPLIIEKNGVKIGILGFTEFLRNLQSKDNLIGVAFLEEKIFIESIEKTREVVDFLIVVFHWGEEYTYEPTSRQKYFAHKSIEKGADLVIGHHPHVIQKIEKYKDKWIFYSLGNFIFDQNFSDETMKGGLVELEIKNKEIKSIYFRIAYLNQNFQIKKISEKLIPFKLNDKIYKLRVANEPQGWETGLMYVKKPVDYDGMIFFFPDKQIRYFWNKNTFVDLDVYWLDDDRIVGKDMLPSIDKTNTPYKIKSPLPVNIVIEIIK